jgi:16S rRNA processing protein RimM
MIKYEEVYKIGRIGKPHGVKGETTLQLSDDVFDRVDADYLVVETDGILVPFFFEEYRFRSDSVVLVKFCDIDTLEQAKELTGCDVYFPRSLSDNDVEAMTWSAIVGFQLVDAIYNKVVGEITAVDDSTLNVLFEVTTTDGRNILVPASEELIQDVDTQQRTIYINIPEGILDL